MSIEKVLFDYLSDGSAVELYRLHNRCGAYVEILNYGGIVRAIVVPDVNGNFTDVVVGFDRIRDYKQYAASYFGALVGRCANRIADSSFILNGSVYTLTANNGRNHLHGGLCGFSEKLWNVSADSKANRLTLTLRSEDGEEGYPGTADITVTYTFDDSNALCIDYKAIADKDTVINLTNHAYFNLNGHGAGCICGHKLKIEASHFTPIDEACIPTGEIAAVSGFTDFRSFRTLREGLCAENKEEQLRRGQGYDLNYVLDKPRGTFGLAAILQGEAAGRTMEVYTDQPGIQLYTGNFMTDHIYGKDGVIYHRRGALCLETQLYPDAVHHPQWPSPILPAGKEYRHQTVYAFR